MIIFTYLLFFRPANGIGSGLVGAFEAHPAKTDALINTASASISHLLLNTMNDSSLL